jgi:hypothetical protein
MSENSLVDRLEGLDRLTKGAVSYDETAGIKQLYRHKESSLKRILSAGYRQLAAMAILGPLFRRLAQNERSLFAFLSSGEPFGFQQFLSDNSWSRTSPRTFQCDRLYDYVSASLGPSLYAESRGKQWAEVRSVMERLHDADELEVRVRRLPVYPSQSHGLSIGAESS